LDSLGPFLILSPAVPPINQNSSYRGYQNEGNKLWVLDLNGRDMGSQRKEKEKLAERRERTKGGHLIGG